MEFSKNFNTAFDLLIFDEGGYVNDKDDPGGPTKWGITLKTYSRYLKRPATIEELVAMPVEHAKEIYITEYWNPLSLHSLDKIVLAVCIFNSGVLYGTGTAALMTQRALNNLGASVKVDGLLGLQTMKILNVIREDDFLKMFHRLLLERIETLIFNNPKLEKFRRGWTIRAHNLLALADKVSKLTT